MTSFRAAREADSSDLAILADAATRRFVSWVWDAGAAPGQSSFEVGRESIRSDPRSLTYLTKWRVAERDGRVVGGLNSYPLSDAVNPAMADDNDVVRPLNQLKAIAAGTWYISVASVFPEFRSQGIGHAVLTEAQRLADDAGVGALSLLVASFNPGAKSLYERFGFAESARRPFGAFPGSGESGDWILMVKDLVSSE